jgi:hypothetical protein
MLKYLVSKVRSRGAMIAVYLCLGACILGLLLAALHPFQFSLPEANSIFRVFESSGFSYEGPIGLQVIERLPFAIAGLLLTVLLTTDRRKLSRAYLTGVVIIAMIEITQIFVEGRHARWSDLLIASCLLGMGFLVGIVARARISRRSFTAIKLCLIGVLGTMIIALFWWGHAAQQLTVWNCDYELGLGNEIGMQRQWVGTLHEVEISNERSALSILPSDSNSAPLRFDSPSRISANQVPKKFCEQTKSDKEFSVRATIEPSGLSLSGPARILTWSSSIYSQNFLIGEADHRVYFRVKSGPSAFPAVTEISAPLHKGALKELDIEATFEAGEMTLVIEDDVAATGHTTRIILNNGLTLPRYPIISILFAMMILLSVDKATNSHGQTKEP